MKGKKGLIYTTIARNKVILVEEANRSPQITHSGNYMQVVHILLPKLPTEGNHSYQYDKNYTVSILNMDQIMYIALSGNDMDITAVFAFLHDVANEFVSLFGGALATAQPFYFTSFASSLNLLMNRYNNGDRFKSKQVLHQMDDIKDVMRSNIDKILQRGERLDLVIDKTSDLADTATLFHSDARQLKRKTMLEQWKLYGIIGIILVIIATIVVVPFLTTSKEK